MPFAEHSILDGGTGVLYRSTFGTGTWTALSGGGGSAISSLGYAYDVSVGGQTVAGRCGLYVLLSNNGTLSGITHTAGTAVDDRSEYRHIQNRILCFNITAGERSCQMALAVNSTIDASSNVC